MNILIFSVSIGNGHDQVAHTLSNEFMRCDSKNKVKIINTIKFISPILDKVILDSYLNILKFYPRAWGKLYEKTNKLDPIIDINDITNRLMTSKLHKSINSFVPDAIICTHSFPSSIISNLKQKKIPETPLITVITDYNIHTSYVNDHTDYYVIPHENLSYVMEHYGVSRNKILPFGIPIRREFEQHVSLTDVQQKYQLDQKKTVLVMGGGLGLGEIYNIVLELDNNLEDAQIIAIAGRNNRLEQKLKSMATKNKLVVLGFVSNIHELMEAADCIVTKPGGVTTAEVLCKQKPLVIFSPLPGQEYENAEFLLNSGVAVATSDVKKIPILINQMLNFDIRMKSIKEITGYLKKPNAAAETVQFILDKYNK
ncbi:MAG: Monogalactosyldiacylglycerol synthase [Clostridia bacterium]|jgi:processive 1,2-diacylglycerol beta-glucosyltransferase|nr:Monogalactosyldiacylglycerol synthase [Clostridia bacterium]